METKFGAIVRNGNKERVNFPSSIPVRTITGNRVFISPKEYIELLLDLWEKSFRSSAIKLHKDIFLLSLTEAKKAVEFITSFHDCYEIKYQIEIMIETNPDEEYELKGE